MFSNIKASNPFALTANPTVLSMQETTVERSFATTKSKTLEIWDL
jgi:hypothetical protein